MNYDFPTITNINDVLPHIDGRDEFRVIESPEYTTITYAVALEETFAWDSNDPLGSAIRRECRGITFDKEGNIICRPFQKYFNINEREETQSNKVNLYEPHKVLLKYDGSMIKCFSVNGRIVLATKAGETEVSQQALEFIRDKQEYWSLIRYCIDWGYTTLFEWCSLKNQIVVPYLKDSLVLLGLRGIFTGKYVDYDRMVDIAKGYGIPVAQTVENLAKQNIELFVSQVKEWTGQEGIVLRFDNGHMVKCKSEDYVLRHKTKDQINQEKNVIGVILEDLVDDMIPLLLEDDANRLKKFQEDFWNGVNTVEHKLAELYESGSHYENQKDFAVEFVNKLEVHYRSFMFAMRTGKKPRVLLVETIEKNLSTQTRVDNARWMWNGATWTI